jgi:acetolactate synthase-1/2/3 large subunit
MEAKIALDRAAKMIRAAKHPLIISGPATSRPGWRSIEQMRNFVACTGLPFISTQMGKGIVREDSELYLGTAAYSKGDYVHRAVDAADLIIAIGLDPCEKPAFHMSNGGPEVIHIAAHPATFTQSFWPQHEVIGVIGPSVEALGDRLKGKLPNAGALLKFRKEILRKICEGADDYSFPVKPDLLAHVMQKVMLGNGHLALDNGLYKILLARKYRANHPNGLLLDNNLATMGAGLPTGIAAALHNPGCRVMAICGDGGVQMTLAELGTAVELKLNLVVVILVDGGFGMIRWKQAAKGFTDYGTTFHNPDFVTLAEAYGAKGTRVETAADLLPALEAAFLGGGVHVVAVPFDYTGYQ